ncbi:MAG: hypothetical protein NDI61_09485, partial [Bdellovibrionaceae bacterium]|nr:hypothetical protein [Pseudobdellovibrionaceae bacterium]
MALPVLAGCGELKKLDQMRKSTDEMNRTTSEMNQTTRELLEETRKLHSETQDLHSQTEALYKETQTVSREAAKLGRTTDELLDVTRDDLSSQMRSVDRGFAELYDALRQGDSATLRRMSFQKMLEAKTVQNRIAEAGLFLMAFEYQLFSGIGQDISQDRKDILYQQAMMELFLRIDELAPNGEKIAPLASPQPSRLNSRENRASAFNALAAALHKTNRKQEVDSQHKEQVSVYALIIEALRMKPLYDS